MRSRGTVALSSTNSSPCNVHTHSVPRLSWTTTRALPCVAVRASATSARSASKDFHATAFVTTMSTAVLALHFRMATRLMRQRGCSCPRKNSTRFGFKCRPLMCRTSYTGWVLKRRQRWSRQCRAIFWVGRAATLWLTFRLGGLAPLVIQWRALVIQWRAVVIHLRPVVAHLRPVVIHLRLLFDCVHPLGCPSAVRLPPHVRGLVPWIRAATSSSVLWEVAESICGSAVTW
mmetsp:Transcript_47435/g.103279  ORF Transcript_47435/g.103279 Transcript_47435/m.103279 type:complete len:231 (-) Transcript_47435:35-727(-)